MSDFYEKWFSVPFERSFPAIGEYFDGEEPSDFPLEKLLNIEKENAKPFTQELLESTDENIVERRNEISKATRAYFQFQDIFGVVVQNDTNKVFNRHYCYYESVMYLTEGLKCWLGNNLIASFTLLRPFLELSLLHIYWYLRCENNSYDEYYKWLNGEKSKPPFKNILDYIFEHIDLPSNISNKRIERLKEIINNLFKYFCNYNHTPTIENSLTGMGNSSPKTSIYVFTYLHSHIQILLKQIVYLYILTYPKCLYPIDRIRLFGFDGPLGIFFDYNNFHIVRKFIGNENISSLKESFKDHQDIIIHTEYTSKMELLNESQIEDSWKNFTNRNRLNPKADSLAVKIVYMKAHTRALCFGLNYITNPFERKNEDLYDDEKLKSFIMDW